MDTGICGANLAIGAAISPRDGEGRGSNTASDQLEGGLSREREATGWGAVGPYWSARTLDRRGAMRDPYTGQQLNLVSPGASHLHGSDPAWVYDAGQTPGE